VKRLYQEIVGFLNNQQHGHQDYLKFAYK